MSKRLDSVSNQRPRGIVQFKETDEFITQKPHITLHVKYVYVTENKILTFLMQALNQKHHLYISQ